MPVKTIAGLATLGMAVGVVAQPLALAKKKKITTKDMLETSVKTLVGTSLLIPQAHLVGQL